MRRWLPLCWLLMALLVGTSAAHADLPPAQLAAFGRLPILQDGRLKPLDSFARLHFRAVTGKAAPRDNTALHWLAEALFNPARAVLEPRFAVPDADARHRLGLAARDADLYPFQDIAAAMMRQKELLEKLETSDGKNQTRDEHALRALFRSANDFRQTIGAFSLLLPITLPLDPWVREQLQLTPDAPVTLLQLLKLKPVIMEQLQATVAAKKADVASYNAEEQRQALLAYQINLLESVGDQNTLLRLLPPQWGGDDTWRAPWDITRQSLGGAATVPFFAAWQKLATAWQQGDTTSWDAALREIERLNNTAQPDLRHAALSWEIWLNRWQPFKAGLWLALAGLALLGCSQLLMTRGSVRLGAFSLILTQGVMAMALLAQGAGLALRMAILQRPPVTNLYESTLFVSCIALACGLLLSWRRHTPDGLAIGGGIAALLLLASLVFGAEGDTLQVLVAVLDTNFWLATHVVCITTGYAAALVAGMMAHLYLLRRVWRPQEELRAQQARMHKTAIFALLFTAVGTMLGGVWADQSWGRFWGWDPKENGALWIVLWLIWLLHGRLAGQLAPLGFAAGLALVNIVVALAWFGVNLLSVGLHSYGFTDTAAYGLLIFCIAELLIIAALCTAYFVRRSRTHAA